MVFLIPKNVVKIFENWDIQGAILLSFSLHVFLVLFARLRKCSNSSFVGLCIWSVYLLADWTPSFGVGLIFSDNFRHIRNTNASSSKDNLMAFWAPFLLLNFSGPDTITALALEDNHIWRRLIPIFFLQLGASVYVFILTLPGNMLWIPTVFIFIAGTIKYTERNRALYQASWLPSENVNILDLLSYHFPIIKGLRLYLEQSDALRDAEISGGEIEMVKRSSPTKDAADEALRMIEVQLEFLYDMFYTKAPLLHKKIGFLLRLVELSSIVVALGVFTLIERNGSEKFNKIDVVVTYTLLYGAICLDIISLLDLVFSEWTIAVCSDIEFQETSFVGHLLGLYEDNVGKHVLSVRKHVLSLTRQRWSKCKKKPYTKFQALSTPLLFRKWCGSIPRHNLIRYCLCHPKNLALKDALYKVADCFDVGEQLERSLYGANNSFLLELWQFIFNELIITKTMPAWAGQPYEIIFQHALHRAELNAGSMQESLPFFSGFSKREKLAFDHLIIVWHVATDLCYADESDAFKGDDERHFSKLLSDYMLYLLIIQPNMLSEVADRTNARNIFIDICDQALKYFRQHKEDFIHSKEEKKEIVACRSLLSVPKRGCLSSSKETMKLDEAIEMAQELQQLQDKKWRVIGIAWVQMLLFAAYNSKLHIEQLAKGGELISLVWLLMSEHLQVRTFINVE